MPRSCKNSVRHFGGFSLTEVVIVMFILVVLGSIAFPRYAQFVANQQLQAASRKVIADLAYAQRQARQSSASRTVSFDVAHSQYTLAGVAHLDHPSQAYVVKLGDEPFGARIVSASFGGDANLIFSGYGTPDSGGSLVIAVGSRQTTITLDTGIGASKKSGVSMIQLD